MTELTKEFLESQVANLASKEDISRLEMRINEVNQTVNRIDKRDKEDSDAFAKDIVQLQKDVKQLKLKHV